MGTHYRRLRGVLCCLEQTMSKEAEDVVLIIAGLCSAFAVGLSSLLIRRHLMHFSRPVVQVCRLRRHRVSPHAFRSRSRGEFIVQVHG